MKYYEKISFASIGVIKTISIITAPFVRFLTFSTNIVSKLFGVTGEEEDNVTEDVDENIPDSENNESNESENTSATNENTESENNQTETENSNVENTEVTE